MHHFGEKSEEYKQYRPGYPDALFAYLNNIVRNHDVAWDCGTGNGQVAVGLADHFTEVIATDINQAQLNVATKRDNVHYYCCPVEKTHIPDHHVDLITVGQALHWFNLDAFYLEVKRVAKPQGIIAAWCYILCKVNDEIDGVIKKLYADILGNQYWSKERHYIDAEYKTLPFPFVKMNAPTLRIEKELNLMQMIGYINTWSAVKQYQQINQENPINLIYSQLQKVWGEPERVYQVRWPIHLLVGKI